MTDKNNVQQSLGLDAAEKPLERVEEYRFEPIKGYPMLNWHGKRPFTSTQYFPAQHRETYGPQTNGWRNKIFWGDNIQVMSHLLKDFRGQIKLVYIDPPFDSGADYKKVVKIRGRSANNDHSVFEEKQYTDIWTNDEYLQFMYERLILIRELLSEDGSIFLHCDDAKNYLLRSILEEVFGSRLRNEIIWKRSTSTGLAQKRCGTLHDTIYWYSKSDDYTFNMQYHEYDEKYLKRAREDENGRLYIPIPTGNPGPRPNLFYEYKGYFPHPNGYKWTREKMEDYDKQGRLLFPDDKSGRIQFKQYLDEMDGVKLQDIWLDLPAVNPVANERLGYPTQKPEVLLDRIIRMGTNPGDIVFDSFMGSGTTQAVAMKSGRRFIGADINLGAVQITTKRLVSVAAELNPSQTSLNLATDEDAITTYYTGFEVYNVNHYDVFRNPIEARDIVIQALEVNPLSEAHLFDGEKDGRMVKIMPVGRIATREDLNPLLSNMDYKAFESRHAEHPNRPVEKITLVCMGHEPDLAAYLKNQVSPYILDVEVVDILRDKQELQFKRDSEAMIVIRDGKLVIEKFYPMNLLSKLSLQAEKIEDWRELVESVMIDWNYDSAVLQPVVVDIPENEELVAGEYPIPEDAGTIRVKITDLLSESLEQEVQYG